MEANFRPVSSRLCVAETWLAGGKNRGNFCNLWLRSTLHRALSPHYSCVVVWARAWNVELLVSCGVEATLQQMWKCDGEHWYLRAFAKLRRATICSSMSVCPSACNNSAPTGRIFREIRYLIIFRNSFGKCPCLIKIWQVTITWHEGPRTFMLISPWILVRMRNVSDKSCR
jgi:hypothetical protein